MLYINTYNTYIYIYIYNTYIWLRPLDVYGVHVVYTKQYIFIMYNNIFNNYRYYL